MVSRCPRTTDFPRASSYPAGWATTGSSGCRSSSCVPTSQRVSSTRPATASRSSRARPGEPRIKKVEVTLDGGTTWQAATLDKHDSSYGFRLFKHKWTAAAGKLRIGTRATDSAGATQPVTPVWNPSGYLYNAIEYINVEVRS